MSRLTRSLPLIAAAILAAACTASSSPAPASPGSSGSAEGSPSPSAAASASATASPSPAASSPIASPSATTAGEGVWSNPAVVRRGECSDLSATIDDSGRSHVAALCDGGIRYITSVDRVTWDQVSFVPGIDTFDVDPRVAVDGTTVYVASSLLAPEEGGCGDPGLRDVGVFVRSRASSDGAWSDPIRIGSEGDRVQSFRVVDGVIHLTVTNDNGSSVFYQSKSSAGATRIGIPDAVSTSLRVGDDKRARIAYVTDHSIRYAVVDGDHLSVETVAESTKTFFRWPSLVLGTGDRPSIVWTQTTASGGGCAEPDPGPIDGTYVATEGASGWSAERISRSTSQTSLTLDPEAGAAEVVVTDRSTDLFTRAQAGWTSAAIPSDPIGAPVLRHDPATGALVLFGLDNAGVVVLSRS